MKSQLFIHTLTWSLIAVPLSAQTDVHIDVNYERDTGGGYTFTASSNSYAPYTVTLKFTELKGASSPGTIIRTVHYGNNRLTALRPTRSGSDIEFRYSYSWRKGDIHKKGDRSYVYLLPLAPGKQTRIRQNISLDDFLSNDPVKKEQARAIGISFTTTSGDTIYAARGGLVTDTRDGGASTTAGKQYDANENYIEVFHKDGTFGRYRLFQNNGIFVDPGDNVVAGQPIGIAGAENYENGSFFQFMVLCYEWEDDHTYIPLFYLGAGNEAVPETGRTYMVEPRPTDLVTKEMSRREKKKYAEKQ
ncbi:MAG: M23 family metallopeptidase [Mediterranea sp.]|jgi:hypothetical protein|nr:M23 family metallopeptidase [Mediterranea sp.]